MLQLPPQTLAPPSCARIPPPSLSTPAAVLALDNRRRCSEPAATLVPPLRHSCATPVRLPPPPPLAAPLDWSGRPCTLALLAGLPRHAAGRPQACGPSAALPA